MESDALIYFLVTAILFASYFTVKSNLSLIKEKRYYEKIK